MDLEQNNRRAARIGERQNAQAQAFSRAAGSTLARLTRQNYALMGDIVDFTLAQMRLPVTHTDAREMLEQQSADARTLVNKARERAGEYADIVGEMRNLAMNTGALVENAVEERAEQAASYVSAARDSDERVAGGKPAARAKAKVKDDAKKAPNKRASGAAADTSAKKNATGSANRKSAASAGKTAGKASAAAKRTASTASKAATGKASAAAKRTASTVSKAATGKASAAAKRTASTASKAATGKASTGAKRTTGKQGTNKGASTRKG